MISITVFVKGTQYAPDKQYYRSFDMLRQSDTGAVL
jgi:hypothetical protein